MSPSVGRPTEVGPVSQRTSSCRPRRMMRADVEKDEAATAARRQASEALAGLLSTSAPSRRTATASTGAARPSTSSPGPSCTIVEVVEHCTANRPSKRTPTASPRRPATSRRPCPAPQPLLAESAAARLHVVRAAPSPRGLTLSRSRRRTRSRCRRGREDDLSDATRVVLVSSRARAPVAGARHHGVEIVVEDRLLAVAGAFPVLLDVEPPVLGELPDGLRVRGEEGGLAAEQALVPGREASKSLTKSPAKRSTATANRRAPEGTRTPNLLIRSQMLYPLSYGRMCTCEPRPCWPRRGGSGIRTREGL